jgi:hypothetical protein
MPHMLDHNNALMIACVPVSMRTCAQSVQQKTIILGANLLA